MPWAKFFWADWRSDPGLRACSATARGIWMDCLCIAAEADPIGYVLVNGRTPTTTDLARLTGEPEAAVQSALEELERNGVFSRDRTDRIYNRRLVRDARRCAESRRNGKLGGNPKLLKDLTILAGVNPPLIPKDNQGDKAKKPEAKKTRKKERESPLTPTGGFEGVINLPVKGPGRGFEDLWATWPPPRRTAKPKTFRSYLTAIDKEQPEVIQTKADRWLRAHRDTPSQYIPLLITWLNQERWNDEFPEQAEKTKAWVGFW